MNRTWTHQALCAGGRLTVKQMMQNKAIFRATMEWPGEQAVHGKIATRLDDALDYLETALADDAANDAMKRGVA